MKCGGTEEAAPEASPGIRPDPYLGDIDLDVLGDTAQRELAFQSGSAIAVILPPGTDEGGLGKAFHIEKALAAQVFVKLGMISVDAGQVDFHLDPVVGRVGLVVIELAREAVEAPFQPTESRLVSRIYG